MSWFKEKINNIAERLGYFPVKLNEDQLISNLNNLLQDKISQIDGLNIAFGTLQTRHENDTLMLAALMAMAGQDEIVLKWDFVRELYLKNFNVTATYLDNKDIKLNLGQNVPQMPDDPEFLDDSLDDCPDCENTCQGTCNGICNEG